MIMNKLVKNVEKFVYDNAPYTDAPYRAHVESVRMNALKLASKMKADRTVVEVSALLHDVGKIRSQENHHIEGAKMARAFLTKYGCDNDFIEKVEHCIMAHRASKRMDAKTIEAQIIKDADGIAFLDINAGTWLDLLHYMWGDKKLSMEEGVKQEKLKVRKMYDKIETSYGRKLAKANYDELMRMLSFLK
jgi:uncharacterized protein